MRKLYLLNLLIFSILCTILHSQSQAPTVHLISGDKMFIDNVESFVAAPDLSIDEVIDGYYYRYVQFENLPDETEQFSLRSTGIRILEYIPDNVYLLAIPSDYQVNQFLSFEIRSVVHLDPEDKMDQRLLSDSWPSWANAPGDEVKVMIKAYPNISEASFVSALSNAGISVNRKDIRFPLAFTTLAASEFISVAALPFIQFVDIGPDPGEPEDTGGRTLQRANLVDNLITGGLRYDGSGVNIQVRDDGVVGPHIDFQGRIIDYTGGSNSGTHGDGVAGVFSGAGNLDPTVEGGASGTNIYVTNYESTFTDNTITLHQDENVVITNSSYSNGCNDGYTTTTQRVDQQMIDNPNLMHFFSAGNSNNNDCGYGAGSQWGNITGGHKVGKNVMAVANLFADGTLASSSSRGPAHDGRIKPDISAHGQNQISTNPDNLYQSFGGTSAASPTAASSYAQLYHAFRNLNGGTDPNTGFLKAVVLNSAFDMGNRGPDFKFGWGRIDAYQGLQILEDQTYLTSSITQGATNMHNITVPAGVAEVRMMVYWVDPAASVSTNMALVNNIDIHVNDPIAARHDPWLLDHTPNPVNLNNPATRGRDSLNNMEQVLIESPVAGTHTVVVEGDAIALGPQDYYLVWSFHYDEIMVTYPFGGEGFVPGETERIHWDAMGTSFTFNVEYSTDNGGSWNTISSNVNGATRLLNWTPPSVTTAQGLIRVSRGALSDVSDANFSIIGLPQNITVAESCLTGAKISWNAVTGADSYNVYLLGEKYMEIHGTSTDLQYTFSNLPTGETSWFSVQAKNNLGALGRRADAISYFADPMFINCRNTIKLEKTVDASEANAGDTLEYTINFTSFYDTPITNVQITDVLSPKWSYIDNSLTCGLINNGTITIDHGTVNPDQMISCTFQVRSDPLSFSEILFQDDIEGGTGNWTVNNLTGGQTWQLSTFMSNSPTNSWLSPNRGLGNNTQSLTALPVAIGLNPELSFFHLYNTESGWDGGFVEISTNNGVSWTDLGPNMIQNGYNGGLGNGSNPDIANHPAFTGNSGGFIETIVDLSDYSNTTALIRFVFGEDDNTSGIGWYVDDVTVRTTIRQENIACVTYDQGGMECSEVLTLMLPCQVNCDPCIDGVMNGDETDIDCGGSTCPLCPCTQGANSLTYQDEVIPDGTDERLKISVLTMGNVLTGSNSTVNLRAGNEIIFNNKFATGISTDLTVTIEDCQN